MIIFGIKMIIITTNVMIRDQKTSIDCDELNIIWCG